MKTYADSSVLVAVYVPERFSSNARTMVQTAVQLPFTALHRLEINNAFELMVGRKLMTPDQRHEVQRQLQDDVGERRLLPVALDLDDVFAAAADLSRAHSAKWLTRSLDLLHVAAARALGCARFVSADDRQLAVARASGLAAVDIKRKRRKSPQLA